MALKIIYPVCCGMDVHKSFIVACIAFTDSVGITAYKSRRFSTFTRDLKLLAAWLSNNNCRNVCMESTGKYWIPVYNILESTCRILLAHPKYVFGKSSSAILNQLSVCPNGSFDVAPFVSRKCKTPVDKIQSAIEGSVCPEQLHKLGIIRSHLSAINECKSKLESLISSLSDKFRAQVDLVYTVPGVQFFSAVSVIPETGVDMSVFSTAKHLCSWAGFVPQNNESAGKKKTTRVSRADAYLKPLLVQCALTVCNSSKHPKIQHRYLMLKMRRGQKKAIIAICRMLLTAIYAILKTAAPYNPFLYRSHSSAPQNRTFSPDSAITSLKSHGYVIVDCNGVVT